MCSVVWHLDVCSIFLFSAPRKSVSNVSDTENMEQQEQKLMQGGDLVIVIQLTSLEGTLPLPRFLPRNLLNKEWLQYEGQQRGRIFLLSTWDRQEGCPANINQQPLPFPSTSFRASGGGCWGRLGSSRGYRSLGQPELSTCAPCQLPSPPCTAENWHFQGFFTRPDHPQRMCPHHPQQTPIWPGPGGAVLPWAEHPEEH